MEHDKEYYRILSFIINAITQSLWLLFIFINQNPQNFKDRHSTQNNCYLLYFLFFILDLSTAQTISHRLPMFNDYYLIYIYIY